MFNSLNVEIKNNYLEELSKNNEMTSSIGDGSLINNVPFKNRKWMDDESVTRCLRCGIYFTFFIRKHHCRLCKRILCDNCSRFRDYIPENMCSDNIDEMTTLDYLMSYIIDVKTEKKRVCIGCHEYILQIESVKKIIKVFQILKYDVKLLKKIMKVNNLWSEASNYCLSNFRQIQYKTSLDKFSDWEKNALKANIIYFRGHSKYIVNALRVSETEMEVRRIIDIMNTGDEYSCRYLLCGKTCKKKLTSFDAIDLLGLCFSNKGKPELLKKVALDHLKCSNIEFKCYIPFLVYNIMNDSNQLVEDFLIERCISDIYLLNFLYWEIQLYIDYNPTDNYKNFYTKLKENMIKKENKNLEYLRSGDLFVRVIKEISFVLYGYKKYENPKEYFRLKNDIVLPLDPRIMIKEIYIDKIKVKKSATKPLIIPCRTNSENIHTIMYKRESIRKDQIILNIIELMDKVVKDEYGIDLELVKYNILPIDKSSGFIEIVNNSETISYIENTLETSILNYILENNESKTIGDFKNRIVKTIAAYSVLTYLLGVGDRHLDNIMITQDGRLFHIDFDYILGNGPMIDNSNIRVTDDMVNAIGGKKSKYYTKFKELCTIIYNCMRRNIDIFINMIMLIPKISYIPFSDKVLIDQINKRFRPGESDQDANIHLVNKLENSNYTSYTKDKLKDWCHYHSTEGLFGKWGSLGDN